MKLRENFAFSTHHDAVSGTAREKVSIDYIQRLSKSIDLTNQSLKSILNDLLINQIPGMINIENLVDVCFILGKDCRKNLDKFNKDSLNLYVIFNPGVNDKLHLKLNVTFLNFEVFELDSEGEHKIKFDNICTYIHDNTNYKYCTAFIDLQFKKDKLFTILMMKKVDKDNVVQKKSLMSGKKDNNLGSEANKLNDNPRKEDLNSLSFKKNKNIKPECYVNITMLHSSEIFLINSRYFRTNDFVTFFISEGSKNNFNLDLEYLKQCKDIKVVKIDDTHYFGFKNNFDILIERQLFFQTNSDLNDINSFDYYKNVDDYYYNNYTVYNDSTHTVSFNLKEHFLIFNKHDNKNISINIHHCVLPNDNSKNGMASGAYVISIPEPFRVNPLDIIVEDSFIFEGEIVKEIHLRTKISTIKIRIYNSSQNMFEVESVLDPNYIYNDFELMLLVQTNLDNTVHLDNKNLTEFWTDSNSMKMVRRVKNHRFGWNISEYEQKADNFSSNLYPINSIFSIKNNTDKHREFNDSCSNYSFLNINDSIVTVFNDRSQGSTSYKQGEILIGLTRFTSKDDDKGLVRGFSEYHSQYSFLHLTHIITYNTLETESFIRQIHKKPLIFNLDLDNHLSTNIIEECKMNDNYSLQAHEECVFQEINNRTTDQNG
jgi:hypothetical protein